MSRSLISAVLVFACTIIAIGCSGVVSPVAPDNLSITGESAGKLPSNTNLWGLYDVQIDVDSKDVTIIPDRGAMFTANVVNFLNGKMTSMSIRLNEIITASTYTDIDVDVTLKHPFPGMQQYNGYDVRGVFMGDGSGSMNYNSD